MSTESKQILDNASDLLAAAKSLDYTLILNNHVDEVKKLKDVLVNFNIGKTGKTGKNEVLADYASKLEGQRPSKNILDGLSSTELARDSDSVNIKSPDDRHAIPRDELDASIADEGLQDRVGKVYNSLSTGTDRTLAFKQVHHSRGIPAFDVVIAPDYSPTSGLHGIFISESEVMSIVLSSDSPAEDWQVLKRKHYSSADEMIEYFGLLSAGFDLP